MSAAGFPTPSANALKPALALARLRTRLGSRSFYLASFALEGPRRAAAYSLYSFFRGADDAADAPGTSGERAGRVALMGEALARAYAGQPEGPLERALAWAVERYAIPQAPLSALVAAVGGDLGPVRMANWAELDRYCYGVASTVGLAMAPLLGAPPGFEREAAALGRAMQLTNILRDVKEDFANGRVYLPADSLRAAGVAESDLAGGRASPAFRVVAAEVSARAHEAYAASEVGILAIAPPRSRLTVRLMRVIYREILCAIERRNYDVFRERVVIGTARKLSLVARVVAGFDPARPSGAHLARGGQS